MIYPFLHIDPTPSTPGLDLNLAHITEIIQHKNNLVLIKMCNDRSYTFTGSHAETILAQLEAIRRQ